VRPPDRGAERLLARVGVAAALKLVKAAAKSRENLGRCKKTGASRRELDRQREVVESGAELGDRVGVTGVLTSLLDKSLVRRSGERAWMLETIREYARELLEESGEAEAVRARHADHYLALAERAYAERFDRGLTWAGRLEAEHDNLRAALDDLQARDSVQYLRLAGAVGWFWMARSHFAEGTRRLEDALASNVEDGPLTARALTYLGAIDRCEGGSRTR
jgi:predicted ATPase